MLAHVPSFGCNPRGSPDFLAYLIPKACMHVLGPGVPRRLGVVRSASSLKAALAFTYDFSSCVFPKFKFMHFQNRDIKLYTVVLLFLCFLKFLLKLCCR